MSQADTEQYFSIITKAGAALEADAKAKGLPVKLTHVAIGDGNGEEYEPNEKQTGLVHEVLRRQIDARWQDKEDQNIAWLSMVIPAEVGGFWIREFGIYAEPLEEEGEPVLYAIGNHAPYYKPEKILGQSTSHEIAIPIVVSGTANIQIMVKDRGYAAQSALNGVLAQISKLIKTDENYGERITALELFRAAVKEATVEALGLVKGDGATINIKPDGTISVNIGAIDHLGEFRFFWHPTLRPGYMPCYGGVIAGCAEKYPQIWEYLQTSEGQKLCVTEEVFQARVNAIWHTNADGTVVGWNGIGGCARFVQDLNAGTLRMPDIRGCLPEAVGGPSSPGMGECAGFALPPVSGGFAFQTEILNTVSRNGLWGFTVSTQNSRYRIEAVDHASIAFANFNNARVTPVSAVNRPKTFGMIPCAYLGIPK